MKVELRILRYDPEPTSLALTAGEPAAGVASVGRPAAGAASARSLAAGAAVSLALTARSLAAGVAESTSGPFTPPKPHWETYQVHAEPMDRVLDLLIKVKAEQDGSLSFRRSCAHGICGSDAMLINSRNRLACRIRVDQLGKKISVAPLPGLPVVKDLIVDMNGFIGKYRSVKPFLMND